MYEKTDNGICNPVCATDMGNSGDQSEPGYENGYSIYRVRTGVLQRTGGGSHTTVPAA